MGDIIFSVWFFLYLFAEWISEAAMGRTGVCRHDMINMTIRELLYDTFADFSKTGISLYNINFAERNSKAAMGGGENIFFRLQRSSIGCSVAQKGKA